MRALLFLFLLLGRATAAPERDPGVLVQLAGRRACLWAPRRQPAPLVLFSHGFHGNCRQSKFLCRSLAGAGYLVVAPDHRDATVRGRGEAPLGRPNEWTEQTYRDRRDDLVAVADALRSDPRVDWGRGVTLCGHSLGGYTVLGLAGAWPSWRSPFKIGAVLALSPYVHPFRHHGNLAGLQAPVMYQSGTLDAGVRPFLLRGAWEKSPRPRCYVEFQRAGHLAWTDLNPRYHLDIAYYCRAFLDHEVKGRPTELTRRLEWVSDLRLEE